MGWREDAEARLPRGPTSEPKHLREDILDELADHLVEALERERRGGSVAEPVAWSRVRERFGDPVKIALQLWWQAMGAKVMREWAQTILLGALVVAVLAMAGAMYRQSEQTNAALSALATSSAALANSVTSIAPAAQTDPTQKMYRKVEFHMSRGDTGAAAAGVNVQLQGSLFGTESTEISSKTGEDGMATFGPIHTGKFGVRLYDESLLLTQERVLTLFPDDGAYQMEVQVPQVSSVTLGIEANVPVYGRVSYRVLLRCRHGEGDDLWESKYELIVDARGVGVICKPRDTFTLESGNTQTGEESRAKELIEAAKETPQDPVRPSHRIGDARRIEFPAATEIVIQDFAIEGAHAPSPQRFSVVGGKENRLTYEFDPLAKENMVAYIDQVVAARSEAEKAGAKKQ